MPSCRLSHLASETIEATHLLVMAHHLQRRVQLALGPPVDPGATADGLEARQPHTVSVRRLAHRVAEERLELLQLADALLALLALGVSLALRTVHRGHAVERARRVRRRRLLGVSGRVRRDGGARHSVTVGQMSSPRPSGPWPPPPPPRVPPWRIPQRQLLALLAPPALGFRAGRPRPRPMRPRAAAPPPSVVSVWGTHCHPLMPPSTEAQDA